MPVTGCSSSAGTCSGAGSRLFAVAERHPRLDVGDVADALGAPARRDARADRDRVGACRSRPTCSSAVSAPSGRISANANGFVERVLARPRFRDPRERLHGAARADLDPVVAVGRDRRRSSSGRTRSAARARARRRGARLDAAVAQAGEEAPDHRPDRARVAARILEHVLGGKTFRSSLRPSISAADATRQIARSRPSQ